MKVMIFLLVILFVYMFFTYNSFVKKKNKIKQAASGIDVYLTQRFDLIPNLVECVKAYMIHEKELLAEIVKLREQYFMNKNLKQGEMLNSEYNKVIAIAESYPELKSSEQFLNLQKSLTKIENQLQAARRVYNAEVNIYNNSVQMFPSGLLASFFGFKEEEYFEAGTQERNSIEIKY